MRSFLTLDIETVPQARYLDPQQYVWRDGMLHPADDWKVDGRGWLEWAIDDPRGLDIEAEAGEVPLAGTHVTPALHATTCHIVQVSFGWRQEGEIKSRLCQLDAYESEQDLLIHAIDILASAVQKRTTLVSFNGKAFDLPVLRARVSLLHMEPPKLPWRRLLYPYSDDQHADLRLILGADDRRARGTLQWWADAFGIHAEEHGAEVGAWVLAGEWDKLRGYGETEAKTLVELFEAVEPIL